jgi:hypothetical protein
VGNGRRDRQSIESLEKQLADLSSTFGEAHAYATHRVIEYHHWMLARNGILLRSFAYLGETGEVLSNTGPVTVTELKLGKSCGHSKTLSAQAPSITGRRMATPLTTRF